MYNIGCVQYVRYCTTVPTVGGTGTKTYRASNLRNNVVVSRLFDQTIGYVTQLNEVSDQYVRKRVYVYAEFPHHFNNNILQSIICMYITV